MTPLLIILAIYALASTVSFVAIAFDKRRAVRGGWRMSERRLHLFELVGGFPGSLLARRLFRHKTRKNRYRLVAAGIVTLHVVAWGAAAWFWLLPHG